MTLQSMSDRVFLALTIWREARGETTDAQIGVAFVILNRVKHPGWWGTDIQSVIFKKWQFSSFTDPNDKQLTTWPSSTDISWNKALQIANDTIDGITVNPVKGADSYYDISIPAPKWTTPDTFVAQLGRIRFYNLDHDIET